MSGRVAADFAASPNLCSLDHIAAASYTQEFVHSDEGRTKPSLGSLLGCEAQILQLDVLDIHMDF